MMGRLCRSLMGVKNEKANGVVESVKDVEVAV